jgi:hypothetical protein
MCKHLYALFVDSFGYGHYVSLKLFNPDEMRVYTIFYGEDIWNEIDSLPNEE